MNGDTAMRDHGNSTPVPQFENPAWVTPKPLSESTVAIVTSAALFPSGGEEFSRGDTTYRALDRADRNLVLGHWSPNFDRTGFAIDLNVVYPIDRLEELAAQGVIGGVSEKHYSFAGNQPDDVATLRMDSGPAAAAELKAAGVDVAILTPV